MMMWICSQSLWPPMHWLYICIYIYILAWLADHKYDVAFETMQPEELAEYRRRFYGDLASKRGEEYNKSSLINIRAGLNSHVTSPPWNLQINLMHDSTFQSANQVFKGLLRHYRIRMFGQKSAQSRFNCCWCGPAVYHRNTQQQDPRCSPSQGLFWIVFAPCAPWQWVLVGPSQRQFYDSQKWEWSPICNSGIPWAGEESSGLEEERDWSWSSNVWAARWWELSRMFLWEVSVEDQSWMHCLFPEAENRI